MSVHKGHRKRVKEKILECGFKSMNPHEVLEFLLFFANPRGDTNPIAHTLLNHFGDIQSVFEASYEELLEINGIGENAAILILSIPHFSREYLSSKNKNTLLNTSALSGKYLIPRFVGRTEETVILTLLDNKMCVIKSLVLTEGSVNSTHINIRNVVELSLKHKASAIILAHNHPNGIALPSAADIHTTRKLREALILISVSLSDHIIVADDDFVSMADSNLI